MNRHKTAAADIAEAFRKAEIIKYRGEYVLGYTIKHDMKAALCREYDCNCFREAIPDFFFQSHSTTLSIGPAQCEHGYNLWLEYAPILRRFHPMPMQFRNAVYAPEPALEPALGLAA